MIFVLFFIPKLQKKFAEFNMLVSSIILKNLPELVYSTKGE